MNIRNKRVIKKITALDYETWLALSKTRRDREVELNPLKLWKAECISTKTADDLYIACKENSELDLWSIENL